MQNSLENEVKDVVKELKKHKKIYLAEAIRANWDLSLLAYSKKVNSYRAKAPLEKIFKQALVIELDRLGYKEAEIQKILNFLKTNRFLQTGPHISPAQKPRYFFINYLSSLAKSPKDYYLVAMYSGVPFSNTTKPGRLSKSDGDINLVPSVNQDALVYQSKISTKMLENFSKSSKDLQKLLPPMKEGEDYTKWALSSALKIEKDNLHGKPVFFDFNEVVKNYLLLALSEKNHVINDILFNKENLKILESVFKDEVIFYKRRSADKYDSVESYYLKGGALQSNKNKIVLTQENLKRELSLHSLCPGLPLGFLVYSFLNNFLCGGSFAQIEYLSKYKQNFLKVPMLKKLIQESPAGVLTTGGFKDDLNLYPLDIALGKKVDLKKYESSLFGEAILAIKDILLYQNYSAKYEKDIKAVKGDIKGKKKVHFIGICGKGMSGLAIMLKQKGYIVTGSDEGFYDPVATMLTQNKINFVTPHKKDNLPLDSDFIIIGKHAKLVPESNEEVKMAFASGIPIKSLPEAIGDLIQDKENTVITGSFGKSTMTALITHCLISSKKDPSYFIGAVPLGFKQNAHLGKGKDFILEGDEYPSANWDTNSKFLYLNPTNALLISAEHDHINVFPTEKDYIAPYENFVKLLPKNGLLVASKNAKNVLGIAKKSKSKVAYYDLKDKTLWHGENITYGTITSFNLFNKNKKVTTLETTLLGKHNIENIIGASAFLLEKKIINIEQLKKGVKSFKGVSGRIDLKTSKSSVLVYEGFGSSYSKAKSVFDALQLHYPNKKLITVFEPHTFSWRNKEARDWYTDVFATSNIVLVLPPPGHGSSTHSQMTQDDIVKIVRNYKSEVYAPQNEAEALTIIKKVLSKDDLIALITSGSLFGLTQSIPKLVEKLFPKE